MYKISILTALNMPLNNMLTPYPFLFAMTDFPILLYLILIVGYMVSNIVGYMHTNYVCILFKLT